MGTGSGASCRMGSVVPGEGGSISHGYASHLPKEGAFASERSGVGFNTTKGELLRWPRAPTEEGHQAEHLCHGAKQLRHWSK